jgi:hypothetical protein
LRRAIGSEACQIPAATKIAFPIAGANAAFLYDISPHSSGPVQGKLLVGCYPIVAANLIQVFVCLYSARFLWNKGRNACGNKVMLFICQDLIITSKNSTGD